jgi:hypothetical protein
MNEDEEIFEMDGDSDVIYVPFSSLFDGDEDVDDEDDMEEPWYFDDDDEFAVAYLAANAMFGV